MGFLGTLLLTAWSVVSWLLVFTLSVSVVLLSVPFALVVPFERWQGTWPTWIIGRLPHLTLSRMSVTRDPAYDPKRTCVYVQNHVSSMDGYVSIHALPHPFCGLLNASFLTIPGYGWIMRMGNAIGVPKSRSGRLEAITAAARDRAERNISILVFPEGHRTRDGKMRSFRTGTFFMARDAGLPIVPVAVSGLYDILPRKRWVARPGHIRIHVCAPIETAGLTDEQVDELAKETQAVIQERLDQSKLA